MKKFIAILIAVLMVLSFSACGKKEAKTSFGKAAIYSVDLTELGYDLKVENGTWQDTYDKVIGLVKAENDPAKRMQLMHKAEDLLMSTGCLTPIYYYTDIFMKSTSVKGFFSSPLGYKFFNKANVNGKTNNIDVCIASEPDTIDPALNSAVDGATLISHLFSGLIKWDQDKTGKLVLVADAAKEIPEKVVNADGTVTYVFELKDGLKWSDGSDVTAADFEYAWKRAANPETGADYNYMFDVIQGYENDGAINVTSEGNKLTVVLNADTPYFIELCAFPTYFPVKESVAANENWATDPATYVCNGPYTMASWEHGSQIILTKNEDYWNAKNVTMKKITFNLTDDNNAMLANFKNGTWQFIDDVPNDEIETLKVDYPKEFFIEGQLGTYYTIFNVNADLLPDSDLSVEEKAVAMQEIRQAFSLLLDRNYIVEEIGQAGQLPASSFVAMGLTEPDGTQFYKNAGHNDGFIGYYNVAKEAMEPNIAQAIETLKKYYTYDEATNTFTDVPAMTYLYNTGTGHQAIGEYVQGAWAAYGITINLENQEWNTFLNTRKDGNYEVARNGWLGDFNDPISFLDMWLTTSGNNDVQFGR